MSERKIRLVPRRWFTRSGEPVHISDMTDQHLLNTIGLVYLRAFVEPSEIGESHDWSTENYLHDKWGELTAEATARGLAWEKRVEAELWELDDMTWGK